MNPPWEEHPYIPMYSIGWRMGPGEDYIHAFNAWIRGLPEGEREAFRKSNPEPENWSGWYDEMLSRTRS